MSQSPLRMRRIDCARDDAEQQIDQLLAGLTLNADVVSEKGRALTERVFGEALPPSRVVERICRDVRDKGTEAALRYTEQLDNKSLTADALHVPRSELIQAHQQADPGFLKSLRRIRKNIMAFQSGLVQTEAVLPIEGKHELRLRFRPVRRVGVCVPGGAAAYPSTLLMTVCPAQAAGVREIAVVMPPTPMGAYNTDLLATCHELGVSEVYRIGGAQAVASLAYGLKELPRVDMIVGPGNIFVTLAKKHVFGEVSIDCLAGPSEVVVVADDSANPEFVAADLIAQAEHDPASSVLVTWHEPLMDMVEDAIERQLRNLERSQAARRSLLEFGAFVLARNEQEAVRVVNRIGPEHLHIQSRDASGFATNVDNAGAIFLGDFTPVALGDYAAGPSHVLPTGGTTRFASGLSAGDFLRRTSVLSFSSAGLKDMANDVRALAVKEGLTAHAASVDVRLRDDKEP